MVPQATLAWTIRCSCLGCCDVVRICILYDCLFPHTVGGAERWYRNLAQRLAVDGHEVTYATMRQWPARDQPEVPGVRVVAIGPRMRLYTSGGRRRILQALCFGVCTFVHLIRRGRRYEVVHTASFPYFSLLAAAALRPLARYRLVVDWFEVWSEQYWREYLGRAGAAGIAVQRLCARVRQHAFCFSWLHAARLRREGLRGDVVRLAGIYSGPLEPEPALAAEPVVLFAGRLIPEKRAPLFVAAVGLAAACVPGLRGVVFGDGPARRDVLAAIAALERPDEVEAAGFVDAAEVHERLRRACCLLLPSRREGYGLIVVEAAACGTPSIVVREPDNAAVELIVDGVNGVIAGSAAVEDLAAAIVRICEAGQPLRTRTQAWFVDNAARLSLERSLDRVLASYRAPAQARS
jgi:glycosyltransferase involved in cell wall biosynthesis